MTEEYDLLPDSSPTTNITNTTGTNTSDFGGYDPYSKGQIKTESLAVIFIFFVLLLGGIVRIFSKKYRVKL